MGAKLLIFICLVSGALHAQDVNLWQNRDYNDLVQRYRLLSGTNQHNFHSSSGYYSRGSLSTLISDSSLYISEEDRFNQSYLMADNNEYFETKDFSSKKPILKHFYKTKADFYSVDTKEFNLHINPVLHFRGGRETAADPIQFINTRGIRVRGSIYDKISFFSYIGENQMTTPQYVRDFRSTYGVLPNEGFFKSFNGGASMLKARNYFKCYWL